MGVSAVLISLWIISFNEPIGDRLIVVFGDCCDIQVWPSFVPIIYIQLFEMEKFSQHAQFIAPFYWPPRILISEQMIVDFL